MIGIASEVVEVLLKRPALFAGPSTCFRLDPFHLLAILCCVGELVACEEEVVGLPVSHTDPTKLIAAMSASHLVASAILFDSYFFLFKRKEYYYTIIRGFVFFLTSVTIRTILSEFRDIVEGILFVFNILRPLLNHPTCAREVSLLATIEA